MGVAINEFEKRKKEVKKKGFIDKHGRLRESRAKPNFTYKMKM